MIVKVTLLGCHLLLADVEVHVTLAHEVLALLFLGCR
jgi:hypothetical protein